tara:strand:+ start:168 stop:425 length:258 start_codon:yes stop_codon:yes gene_type:complete
MKKARPITQRAKCSPLKMNPAMAVVGAYQTQNQLNDFTESLNVPEEAPQQIAKPPGKPDPKPTPEMCKKDPTLPGCPAQKLNEEE